MAPVPLAVRDCRAELELEAVGELLPGADRVPEARPVPEALREVREEAVLLLLAEVLDVEVAEAVLVLLTVEEPDLLELPQPLEVAQAVLAEDRDGLTEALLDTQAVEDREAWLLPELDTEVEPD